MKKLLFTAVILMTSVAAMFSQARLLEIYKGDQVVYRRAITGIDSIKMAESPDGQLISDRLWAKFDVADADQFASNYEGGKFYQCYRMASYTATDAWPGAGAAFDGPRWVDDWYDSYGGGIDGNIYQFETQPCPDGWHIPSDGDIESLVGAGSTWAAANEKGNPVAGRFFGENHAVATVSDLQGCIFIPALGRRNKDTGDLEYEGERGYYHSQNPYWGHSTQMLKFSEDEAVVDRPDGGAANWGQGAAIRCIKN
jgi:uncharacterized protein (TIGR02145 family)